MSISFHFEVMYPLEERYYFKLNIFFAVTATALTWFSNRCPAAIRVSNLSTVWQAAIRIIRVSKDESFIKDRRAAGPQLQPWRTAPFPYISILLTFMTLNSTARIMRFKYVIFLTPVETREVNWETIVFAGSSRKKSCLW